MLTVIVESATGVSPMWLEYVISKPLAFFLTVSFALLMSKPRLSRSSFDFETAESSFFIAVGKPLAIILKRVI